MPSVPGQQGRERTPPAGSSPRAARRIRAQQAIDAPPVARTAATFSRKRVIAPAAASGTKYSCGWGSKLTPSRARRAAGRARTVARTPAWWPRCTPSEVADVATRRGAPGGGVEAADQLHRGPLAQKRPRVYMLPVRRPRKLTQRTRARPDVDGPAPEDPGDQTENPLAAFPSPTTRARRRAPPDQQRRHQRAGDAEGQPDAAPPGGAR